jgi:hypothetical protein
MVDPPSKLICVYWLWIARPTSCLQRGGPASPLAPTASGQGRAGVNQSGRARESIAEQYVIALRAVAAQWAGGSSARNRS